ncbi:MAG: MBL fold metallo-hydrolase [Steroidobacteraceae bacterium]
MDRRRAGMVRGSLGILLALCCAAASAANAPGAAPANQFITLGTHGGPVSDRNRSQPANALVVGQQVYLVDAGDGAVQQLARAGLSLAAVRAVFISHIHIDHTGGLFAVLGLRHQMGTPGKITVYGPPGTKAMVQGLLAAIVPEAESGYGVPGEDYVPPQGTVDVVELRDGMIKLEGFSVAVAENTHYSFPKGSDLDRRFASISYRFNLPDRSIVYSGDTGPSESLTALARGADLLVIELADPAFAATFIAPGPGPQPKRLREMHDHMVNHHISPQQVGEIAAKAQVRRVVITHLVAGRDPNVDTAPFVAGVRKIYTGPVEIANDLNRY